MMSWSRGLVLLFVTTTGCSGGGLFDDEGSNPNPARNRVSFRGAEVVYEFDESAARIGGLSVYSCPQGCEPWDCKGGGGSVWSISSKTGTCLKSGVVHGKVPPEANPSGGAARPLIKGTAYQYQVLQGCDGSSSSYSATCFTAP